MDLSRIAIQPRLREGWEAVDMGIAMTRAWWLPLQISWIAPSAIVFLCLLPLFSGNSWIAFLITWWLNPLWDRFPLLLASRALFDEPLRVRAAWSEWKQVLKRDWFAWLTWRRFSPTRCLDMPITILEQLRGEERNRRLNVLHRNASGVAFAFTLLCLGFEIVTLAAIWMFLLLFIPQEFLEEELLNGFNNFFWFSQWSVLIWFVAMALVSPFYVVVGFALYINRRIELEGWDIEIRFRHLVERYKTNTSGHKINKVAAFLLPVIVLFSFTFSSQSVIAQDDPENTETILTDERSETARQVKQEVIDILSGEDFDQKRTEKGWRFKQTERADGEESAGWFLDTLANIVDWLSPLFKVLGAIFSTVPYIIWILCALLLAFLVYHFRDALTSMSSRHKKEKQDAVPEVLFGLDLRKESLPDDIPAEVRKLWQDGKHREAIGLLYRATLSGLIHKFSFEFFDGYTEQECANIVVNTNPGSLSVYVQGLTSAWQQIAYAHRLPSEDKVVSLCSEWENYFSDSNPSPAASLGNNNQQGSNNER